MDSSASPYRLRALLLFSVIFVSYAYFYEGAGWNQNSRLDMVRAIVEQGTLRIDAFHEDTKVHKGRALRVRFWPRFL